MFILMAIAVFVMVVLRVLIESEGEAGGVVAALFGGALVVAVLAAFYK